MKATERTNFGNAYTAIVAQSLNENPQSRTLFSGRSMMPTLTDGMQILLEKVRPSEIKASDIIMYKKPDRAVVHRVIGIIRKDGARLFITKGDNHAYIDTDYISENDLIGRVRGAFFEDDPHTDILIKSGFLGALYVINGRLILNIRRLRKHIPKYIRLTFKFFVGGFFYITGKTIHAAYLGTRYGKLFFRRRTGNKPCVQAPASHCIRLF